MNILKEILKENLKENNWGIKVPAGYERYNKKALVTNRKNKQIMIIKYGENDYSISVTSKTGRIEYAIKDEPEFEGMTLNEFVDYIFSNEEYMLKDSEKEYIKKELKSLPIWHS